MKRILCFFMLITSCHLGFAQKDTTKLLGVLPLKNNQVYYSGVIEVDSTNKEEIYSRVKEWFVNNYTSANDVIQLDDKENFQIIGKGIFKEQWQANFMYSYETSVHHTIKISVKDNKFKYEIYSFHIAGYFPPSQYSRGSNYDTPIEQWGKDRPDNSKKLFTQINNRINKQTEGMSQIKLSQKKSDW